MKAGGTPFLLLFSALWGACRVAPIVGPLDLQAPGWSIRQGQAVWIRQRGDEAVAGELLFATRTDGACFLHFAKPPFTLATASSDANGWSAEDPPAGRHFAGRGPPPGRFVWFALADALREQPVEGRWLFQPRGDADWCLTNAATGEGLEGYLKP